MILALAMACSGGSDSSSYSSTYFTTGTQGTDTQTGSTHGTDTQTTTDPTDTTTTGGTFTLPAGLNGTPPAENLPVPSFDQVVADDGTARTSADLQGAPTVIWFYPAAFTGG
jgi:hypothetical protein